MRYLALFLVLLLFLAIAFAQGSDDPGMPDTVYYAGAGCHSSDTLYISALQGVHDVYIDCYVWTDNDVAGVNWPQVDRCYNNVSYPTYLDPIKNTETLVFTGTLLESADGKILNLGGVPPSPTPPHFMLGAVKYTGAMFGAPGGVAAHLCFTVQDTGCICLDTTNIFYPPPNNFPLTFTRTDAILYVPIVKPQCFHIASLLFGDCNSDESINLTDIILLANYMLKGGPAPNPLQSGDVNCDSAYNLVDAILLARYLLLGELFPC